MQYLGAVTKVTEMISVHFQGKPFNITVIQVYAPITNAEEAGFEQFCEDLRRQWHPTPVLLPGKIPWMEEPSRLQSMGSLRVRHD